MQTSESVKGTYGRAMLIVGCASMVLGATSSFLAGYSFGLSNKVAACEMLPNRPANLKGSDKLLRQTSTRVQLVP